MTPQERWEAAREHVARLTELAQDATPAPWRPFAMGSEGYTVLGPQGSVRGAHRKHTPRTALCTHEDWDTDKANAHAIAAIRNAAGGLLATAQTVLLVHRPADPDASPWATTHCAGCRRERKWPCALVEPLLNAFGIRP